MKQSLGLYLLLVSTTLLFCQVQGGIITNQQTLTLPKELADSIASASNTASSDNETEKNATRTGRVMYTAPYSNVRISSKEPKSLKYFPIPAVISKKHVPSPTVIVPVLRTSTTTTTTLPTTTLSSSTTTTSTTTTTTSTTTTPPPPPSTSAAEVQAPIPDIIEILEEIEPSSEDEVVTETITGGGDIDLNNDDDDDNNNDDETLDKENIAVTEQSVENE